MYKTFVNSPRKKFFRFLPDTFFKADWFILFIPMQWTHFQSWQMG